MKRFMLFSPLLLLGLTTIEAAPLELTPMVGKNFYDNDAPIKDKAFLGIRANQYITPNSAIMLGYDHIFKSDYSPRATPQSREIDPKENQLPTQRETTIVSTNPTKSAVDRFYLNILHDFHPQNSANLTPYLFGGLGYERVDEEREDFQSQGFANVGGGLKIALNPNLNFNTEAKALKMFDDHRTDFAIGVGLGYRIAANSAATLPSQVSTPVVSTATPLPQSSITTIEPTEIIEEEAAILPVSPIILDQEPMVQEGYYVQLAAAFHSDLEKDCTHYIHEVEKLNEPYFIYHTFINDKPVQLLLVGPYESKAEAKSKLPKLRRIEGTAFIKYIQ